MKHLLLANDIIWIAAALVCIFYESPVITAIVCFTTVVYALDLLVKFKKLKWNVALFLKAYWLDILFLIPFAKIFRGFRIFKVGRIFARCLKIAAVSADLSEMAFRTWHFLKNSMSKQA